MYTTDGRTDRQTDGRTKAMLIAPFPTSRDVIEGKGKGQDTCYSAVYMSQTRDQQRFYNLGSGS